jgi:hypothetical protein
MARDRCDPNGKLDPPARTRAPLAHAINALVVENETVVMTTARVGTRRPQCAPERDQSA